MTEIMRVIRGQRRFQQDPPSLPPSFLALLLSFRIRRLARGARASPRHFPGGDAEPKTFPPDRPAAADGRGRGRADGGGAESRDDKTMFYPKRDWVRSVMTTTTPQDPDAEAGEDGMEMPKSDGIKNRR